MEVPRTEPEPTTQKTPEAAVSDEHGSHDPRGLPGMGVMGTGAGHHLFTLDKPAPIVAGFQSGVFPGSQIINHARPLSDTKFRPLE